MVLEAGKPGRLRELLDRFRARRGVGAYRAQSRIYKIPEWNDTLYNKGKIIFSGDAAGHVMPLSFEGIYYAMKSGSFAAEAVRKEDVGIYKKIWKSNFYSLFTLLSRMSSYFLKNNRRAEQFISICKNDLVQDAAKRIWLKKIHGGKNLLYFKKILGKSVICH